MSEQRRDFQRLNDLNLSSFWWHGGTDWTPVIKDEVNLEQDSVESYSGAHKPIVYSVFSILALLGAAMLTRTGEIFQRLETAQNQPVQQVIYHNK